MLSTTSQFGLISNFSVWYSDLMHLENSHLLFAGDTIIFFMIMTVSRLSIFSTFLYCLKPFLV